LVFVTNYRHPVFTAIDLDRREAIMRAVGEDFGANWSSSRLNVLRASIEQRPTPRRDSSPA
jgi:REP element-mobilizing transposase RayT